MTSEPKWAKYINEDEVRRAVSVLKPDNQLFEIRILREKNGRKETISGYFTDVDTMLKEFDTCDFRDTNVYFTLGYLKQAVYSRSQKDKLRKSVQTTSDTDIDGFQWLFIDLDPVRPAGVSASNAEVTEAKDLMDKVYLYLQRVGFEEPIKALSGNGCHLLYHIRIKNDGAGRKLVEDCLKVLSQMFDTEGVKIDTSNYNPARICKLYGTLAQKGTSTTDRPHRFSRILSIPDEIRVTSSDYLKKLAAALVPESPNKNTKNQYQRFDLEDFLDRHGLTYRKKDGDRSEIFELDECPFDPSHKNGDSKIFRYPDGAVAFKCHHNSCSGYTWQDVRAKFEPEAYNRPEDDAKYDKGWQEHNRLKKAAELEVKNLSEDNDEDVFKIYRTASEILAEIEPDREFIKTGILTIDRLTAGLAKTEITAITGFAGSGKSTLLAQIMLNAIDNGHRVVCYSGEMSNRKYLNWMMTQAAGKANVVHSAVVESDYHLKNETIKQKIVTWMGDNFRLYDNRQGNDFKKISKSLERILLRTKADLCVIDNIMILDLYKLSQNQYEAQTAFVKELKNMALKTNTHIIFVAHPRKTSGFINLSDISGTANIGNMLDTAFVVHRCGARFTKAFKEEYGGVPESYGIDRNATNVLQIAKERDHGCIDKFISLFYERETKRLRNSIVDNAVYGWNEQQ